MKKIILVLMVLLLIACEKENIRIGVVGSLSGTHSDIGVAMRDGLLYKVDQVNQSGGINGRQVELLIYDDQGDYDLTERYTEELFEEKVDAIIGYEISGKLQTISRYKNKGIIMISPTLSSYTLSGQDDYFYRTIVTNYMQGTTIAYDMMDNYEDYVAIFDGRNREFAMGIIEGFESVANMTLESHGFDDYLINFEDEVIDAIGDAEAILAVLSPYDTLTLGQFILKHDMDVQVYSSNWGIADDSYQEAGKALEGVYFISMYGPGGNTKLQAFVEGFQDKFSKVPQYSSVYSYEAATILFEAMSKSKSDFSNLKEQMDQLETIEGVISDLKFDPYGDIIRDLHFFIYHNGALEYIE